MKLVVIPPEVTVFMLVTVIIAITQWSRPYGNREVKSKSNFSCLLRQSSCWTELVKVRSEKPMWSISCPRTKVAQCFSILSDLQIVLSVPAGRRGNSVCRLLEAIWVGPGFSLGVIKVIGRMPALCDVDIARSPALSLCKVCSSLKVE